MASVTQWWWIWTNSERQWRTGKPGMLHSMGSQRVGHDWAIEQQQRWELEKRLWQRHTERESGEAWCVSAVLNSSGRNSISCRACNGRVCWALPQSFWFCRSERDASFVLLSVQMMQMLLGRWLPFEHYWLKLLLPTPQVILSAELEARRTLRISLKLGSWFWAKEDRYLGLLWKFESIRTSWAWGWQRHSKILPPREEPVTSTCFLGT